MALYLKRVKKWEKYENITAKEWIEKYVSKKVYEVVWGPLLYQKFADRAEEISMAWLYGRISARFKSREKGGAQEVLGYMEGSFEVLINTMEKIILEKGGKIFKSTPVNKIIAENNKLKAIKSGTSEYELDALILTCSPMIIKKLL